MCAMTAQREELIRLARESGLPVPEDATVTEVVQLLSELPETPLLTDELSEALDCILGNIQKNKGDDAA